MLYNVFFLVFVIGLQAAQNRAIDITLGQCIDFHKSIVVTQRFFYLFEPNKKIHISRSMARILKNKPLIES